MKHRTAYKVFTKESKIIRYMRVSRGLTQREVATQVGWSHAKVNHYEQGRLNICARVIGPLLSIYGYSKEEFDEFLNGKPIPVLDVKEECVALLERIDEHKLRAVHAVLVGFIS